MTDAQSCWLAVAFFVIAFSYSTVGFGGGSSYLAVLAAAGLAHSEIPPVALACNILVAGGGFVHFLRAGHFEFKKVVPFVLLSVPTAYWGGSLVVGRRLFCLLLGLSLAAAALRMMLPERLFRQTGGLRARDAWSWGFPIGAGLGFLSGLVGIGGGIFLSPLLLCLRWANVKQAAAAASFFIVVNSAAGLVGQLQKDSQGIGPFWVLALAAFLGGQLGSRLGSFRWPKIYLERILAVLISMVAFKMLMSAA